MKIRFDDINKTVEVPDDADNDYIDDVYDDLQSAVAFKEVPKIENSGNVLQRAAKAAMASIPGLGQAPDLEHPFQSGINATMQGLKNFGPGMAGQMGARETKTDIINEVNPGQPVVNFGLDMISNPETLAGGSALFKGIKGAGKMAKPITKNIERMMSPKKALKFSNQLEEGIEKTGSGLSKKMGSAMESAQAKKPGVKISFAEDISRPKFDSKVNSLLDKTDSVKYQDMDNLTLKESQQIISDLKANLRQGLKTGEVVKSDERGILEFINKLRAKQLKAFPEEFPKILEDYGEGIEAYRDVAGRTATMLEGKGNRITRAAEEQSLKKVNPEAFGKYKSYQNTKKGVKAATYAAGATGVFGIGKKLLGG